MIIIFILGSIIGSFLNVYITRWPKGYKPYTSRSYCFHCHHRLNIFDLAPVISYICLKGRCRYCHHKISERDWLIEVIGGVFACYCYQYVNTTFEMLFVFSISMLCIMIAFIDADHFYIDHKLLLFNVLLALCWLIIYHPCCYLYHIYCAILIAVPFYLIAKCRPQALGEGDSQCYFLAGLLVGFPTILIVFILANFLCLGYVLIFHLKDCKQEKRPIAYGPWIMYATLFAFLSSF